MTKIFTNPFVYLILFMILVHTARLITKTPFHGQKTYVPSTDKMFITLYTFFLIIITLINLL